MGCFAFAVMKPFSSYWLVELAPRTSLPFSSHKPPFMRGTKYKIGCVREFTGAGNPCNEEQAADNPQASDIYQGYSCIGDGIKGLGWWPSRYVRHVRQIQIHITYVNTVHIGTCLIAQHWTGGMETSTFPRIYFHASLTKLTSSKLNERTCLKIQDVEQSRKTLDVGIGPPDVCENAHMHEHPLSHGHTAA